MQMRLWIGVKSQHRCNRQPYVDDNNPYDIDDDDDGAGDIDNGGDENLMMMS